MKAQTYPDPIDDGKIFLDLVKSEVVKEEPKKYNTKQVDTVSIMSLVDARVLVTGTVTKTQYEFAKAGTVVAVNKLDANELLDKKKGNACCGGQSGKPIFQLA
jgi:hypothetical protein